MKSWKRKQVILIILIVLVNVCVNIVNRPCSPTGVPSVVEGPYSYDVFDENAYPWTIPPSRLTEWFADPWWANYAYWAKLSHPDGWTKIKFVEVWFYRIVDYPSNSWQTATADGYTLFKYTYDVEANEVTIDHTLFEGTDYYNPDNYMTGYYGLDEASATDAWFYLEFNADYSTYAGEWNIGIRATDDLSQQSEIITDPYGNTTVLVRSSIMVPTGNETISWGTIIAGDNNHSTTFVPYVQIIANSQWTLTVRASNFTANPDFLVSVVENDILFWDEDGIDGEMSVLLRNIDRSIPSWTDRSPVPLGGLYVPLYLLLNPNQLFTYSVEYSIIITVEVTTK